MIIHAEEVFKAKKTYDAAVKEWGGKKFHKTYENAVEIQRDKRLINVAIEECRA